MNDAPTTVLLVEDDPADVKLIQDALAGTGNSLFRVEWVTRRSAALKRLGSERFEVVLLDLSLPDSQGSVRPGAPGCARLPDPGPQRIDR